MPPLSARGDPKRLSSPQQQKEGGSLWHGPTFALPTGLARSPAAPGLSEARQHPRAGAGPFPVHSPVAPNAAISFFPAMRKRGRCRGSARARSREVAPPRGPGEAAAQPLARPGSGGLPRAREGGGEGGERTGRLQGRIAGLGGCRGAARSRVPSQGRATSKDSSPRFGCSVRIGSARLGPIPFGSARLDPTALALARLDPIPFGSARLCPAGRASLVRPSPRPRPPRRAAGARGRLPPAGGGGRGRRRVHRPSRLHRPRPPSASNLRAAAYTPPPPHPGRSLGVVPLPPRATWGHPEACRPPRCNSESAAGPPVPCFARFSRGGKPAVPKEHPPAPSGDGTVRPMASALGRARGWVPDHPLAKQPRASQNKQSRRRCFSNHPCEFGVTSRALPGWLEKPSRGCAR